MRRIEEGAMAGGGFNQVTVIIPTLNESQTIGQLVTSLADQYPGIKVLVADDVSKDGTQEIVRRLGVELAARAQVELLERLDAAERGITAAVLDGLARVETQYFAVMDGDLQHPPEVLGRLIDELAAGRTMAVAIRLPYQENQGLHRIAMTRVATRLARLYLRARGVRVSDPMSGFFAGVTAVLRPLGADNRSRFEPEGYKILFDLLKVIDPRESIGQVSYQFAFRTGGTSKLRPAHAFFFLRGLFK
jgi:dolichol-phosphate mannosyltransferase